MNKKSSLSLLTRFSLLTGFLVVASIFMAEIYFTNHERAILELSLREKINFITNYYAFGIAQSLQQNDDVSLQQIINGLEQDRDVLSVIVVDADGSIRYHVDPDKVGTTLDDALVKKCLESGDGVATPVVNAGGKALELVVPLKAKGQPKPQGAVRLDITYKHINDMVRAGPASFEMMAMGCIFSCIGGVLWGFRKWVVFPMGQLQLAMSRINPSLLEANLPETDDEFGSLNKSLNSLLARLKTEVIVQREATVLQAGEERLLIEQLLAGLLPNSRLLLVDKENRVIGDSRRTAPVAPGSAPHLLDIVNDADFSTLIGAAMQKEGEVAQGRVTFESTPCEASILRFPQGQSKLIRMVIALRAPSESETKKEAV
jgi:hypothetical protein